MRIGGPDAQPAVLQLAACHALGAGRGRNLKPGASRGNARLECLELHSRFPCSRRVPPTAHHPARSIAGMQEPRPDFPYRGFQFRGHNQSRGVE